MHDEARTANLLGAASLALSDLLVSAVTAIAGIGSSGSAALVVLSTVPGLSVTELGRRIGLSQPAAARMVDSLDKQGLVSKESTEGRAVAVHLTDEGVHAARRVLASRSDALVSVVRHLDDHEQSHLDDLLNKLLAGLYREPNDADRLCRLCDRSACVRNCATCPVGQADRDHRSDDG